MQNYTSRQIYKAFAYVSVSVEKTDINNLNVQVFKTSKYHGAPYLFRTVVSHRTLVSVRVLQWGGCLCPLTAIVSSTAGQGGVDIHKQWEKETGQLLFDHREYYSHHKAGYKV